MCLFPGATVYPDLNFRNAPGPSEGDTANGNQLLIATLDDVINRDNIDDRSCLYLRNLIPITLYPIAFLILVGDFNAGDPL